MWETVAKVTGRATLFRCITARGRGFHGQCKTVASASSALSDGTVEGKRELACPGAGQRPAVRLSSKELYWLVQPGAHDLHSR